MNCLPAPQAPFKNYPINRNSIISQLLKSSLSCPQHLTGIMTTYKVIHKTHFHSCCQMQKNNPYSCSLPCLPSCLCLPHLKPLKTTKKCKFHSQNAKYFPTFQSLVDFAQRRHIIRFTSLRMTIYISTVTIIE